MGLRVAVGNEDRVGDDPTPGRRPAEVEPERAARRRRRVPLSVIAVVIVGVLITAGLSLGANEIHNSNENRLLRQRVREAATVVTAALPNLQTPLAIAAVLAESTKGNSAQFRGLMGPIVAGGRSFSSVSLWPTGTADPRPVAVVGGTPELATEPTARIRQFLERTVANAGTVTLNNLLASADRRVGYAVAASRAAHFVVYAESSLPRSRRANLDKDSAFADLGYALYLGPAVDARYLLASSTGGSLLQGRRASATVQFGDSKLLVVMTPLKQLGGSLLARLWWILTLFGLFVTFGAAAFVGRLAQGRKSAEGLALENARLYAEQRSVAQTLQHSLLAEAFPEVGGLDFAARYVAGVEGIDIGGDWYDVVRLESGKVLIVVGDVSGRGLEAATMMASLRYAARAYALEGHEPSVILSKLSSLVSVARDGHFATILCALLDVASGQITISNAGHPEPLLVAAADAEFVATRVGRPVGVAREPHYDEIQFAFPRGSTLLLYTDGAIERRREHLDVGLERLKAVSLAATGTLDDFLDRVVSGVIAEGAEDDTALLGIRWRT